MASDTAGVNGGRIAFFFLGYMGLFVLGLPALFLALYQRQVGSLDWPPPVLAGAVVAASRPCPAPTYARLLPCSPILLLPRSRWPGILG